MRRFSRKHGVHIKGFSDAALAALQAHDWPGNVRELQNVVERAVILCGDDGLLEPAHLGLSTPVQLRSETRSANPSPAVPAPPGPAADGHFPTLAELERQHILAALQFCKGNRTHAARVLGISIRTLRNKLHEINGTRPQPEDTAEPEAEVPAADPST